ncbi:MAG: hypothetical protein ACTSYW_10485 [Candidatus Heimdallarchaeota archaeon]
MAVENDVETLLALKGMENALRWIVMEEMDSAAKETQLIMKSEAPIRTGGFRSTINYDLKEKGLTFEAEIGPDDRYYPRKGATVAQAIEYGRRAGQPMPPWTEIALRLGVSLSEGYVIARSIARKGIAANPFARRTFETIRPRYERHMQNVASNLVRYFKNFR